MSSDSSFDRITGHLDYPMIVVTTAAGDERAGCLVGFHTQCSIEPPRWAVWISRENHTARVAARADVFALHFLDGAHPSARSLAELFGTATGDTVDKFARCTWHPGPDGVPLLDDCPARLVGQRQATLGADTDHIGIVLAPEVCESPADLMPLMFSQVRDLEAGHEVD